MVKRIVLLVKDLLKSVSAKDLFAFLVIVCILAIICTFFVIVLKKFEYAVYDEVTGLLNFATFKKKCKKLINSSKTEEYMILSLDINDFKFINDSLGFPTGNIILKELAKSFKKECANDIICRFYADNFIFLLKKLPLLLTEELVFDITNKTNPAKAYLPDQYHMTFSTGVYYIEDKTIDITSMIEKANYARKVGKKNYATHRVVEYTAKMNEINEWNREITFSMENAIAKGEFEVFYQPQYSFENSQIFGAEALIRWNKPDKGIIRPDLFIPIFEQNGFIPYIDFFVFEKVCKFLDEWNKICQDYSPHPITISFNLSRQDFYNPNLIADLKAIESKYKIEPCKIEIEVTESAIFENQKRLVNTMHKIKKAGYSVSVDDFGSGYSSLNALKNMPADVLKLDKEFLSASSTETEKEFSIIASIIDMSKKINLMTIAEGVETKEQADILKEMGCDIAQGFYYARPISEKEYLELLKKSFLSNAQ